MAPVFGASSLSGSISQEAPTNTACGYRHVKVINERLRTLEEMVMSSNIPTLFQQTASSVAQIRNPSAGVSAPHTDLSQSRPVTHVDTHTSTIAAFNDSYRLAHASDATDGMGAMCSEPNQQTCFYGMFL